MPLVLAQLIAERARARRRRLLLHVARDDGRMAALAERARLLRSRSESHRPFRPGTACPTIGSSPERADRQPPHRRPDPAGGGAAREQPAVVLTTVNALLQRVPPREFFAQVAESIARRPAHGRSTGCVQLSRPQRLPARRHGLRGRRVRRARRHRRRVSARAAQPVRLDFFGDTLERSALRSADAAHVGKSEQLDLKPISEVLLDDQMPMQRFRTRLSRACSARSAPTTRSTRRSAPGAAIPAWSTGCRCSTSGWRRCSTICRTRRGQLRPSSRRGRRRAARPDRRFLRGAREDLRRPTLRGAALPAGAARRACSSTTTTGTSGWPNASVRALTPFAAAAGRRGGGALDRGPRPGRNFAAERADADANVFEAVGGARARRSRAQAARGDRRRSAPGARDRLATPAGRARARRARRNGRQPGRSCRRCRPTRGARRARPRAGLRDAALAVIAEQDILGDRLVRPRRKKRRAADVHRRGDQPGAATSSSMSITASAATTGS